MVEQWSPKPQVCVSSVTVAEVSLLKVRECCSTLRPRRVRNLTTLELYN